MTYELITEAFQLPRVAQFVLDAKVLALDIETTALDPRDGEIRLVQLNDSVHCFVVDAFLCGNIDRLAKALGESKGIKIIQNAKFEQKWFKFKHGIDLWPLFCTYRASVIIHNGKNLGHNLYDLYARELDTYPAGQDMGGSDWSGPLTKEQYDYASDDVKHLHALRDCLKKKLVASELNATALVEFGVIVAEAECELNGFFLDKEAWMDLAETNEENSKRVRKQLIRELPNPTNQLALPGIEPPFNLDSNDQMLASLRKLGLTRKITKPDGTTATIPLDSTAEIVLAGYAAQYPIIKELFKYREFSKNVSSFGSKYLKFISPKTGRIHCSYFPFTGAGRYSCRDPNLQQIPRNKAFRKCFRAAPGKKLVAADYSGVEMRIASEVAPDPALAQVFLKNLDAHTNTAAILNGMAYEEIANGIQRDDPKYKLMRQQSKAVNFGLIYGMGAQKLVLYAMANYGVSLSLKQAEGFRRKYFEAYPGLGRWHERAYRDGQRLGYTRTLNGRIRYLDPQKAYSEWFNCLDAETEALTQRGWVRGFDLQRTDTLLTKNAETGELEWQQPTDLKQWPDYDGPLVEIRSRSFNSVSTPDHRWLVFNKGLGRDECRTTKELSRYGDHRIHRTGNYRPHFNSVFSDDFVELCGWFVTDGTWYLTGRDKNIPESRLMQSQRANLPKVRRIDALVTRMGVGNGRYVTKETGNVQWRLKKEITYNLHEIFPERRLTPSFLLRLTRSQLELLLETMILGDGWCDSKVCFCTGSLVQAETFQMLCTLTGFSSAIHKRDMRKYKPRSTKLKNIPKGTICYVVNVHSRDKAQVQKKHVREFQGKQPIWCPIVPNTFFVARREGQVFITGNTPVQGTGADALKKALRNVAYRLRDKLGDRAKIVHHVHDEILVEADDDTEVLDLTAKELESGMKESLATLLKNVPVEVDASAGSNWAEVK